MAIHIPEKENHTFVIAVKTFSRMAFGWAICGPLAWMLRAMAHGLATNLKKKKKIVSYSFYSRSYCHQLHIIQLSQQSADRISWVNTANIHMSGAIKQI